MFKFIKPYWKELVPAAVYAFLNVLLMLFIPVLTGRGIDQVSISAGEGLGGTALLLFLSIIGAAGFSYAFTILINRAGVLIIRDMRKSAFEKLMRLPISYLDKHPYGDVMNRYVADMEQILDGLINGGLQLFTGIMTVLITIVIMLSLNVTVALIVMLLTPLSVVVSAFVTKKSYTSFRAQAADNAKISSFAEEEVSLVRIIRAYGLEAVHTSRFDEIAESQRRSGERAQFFSSLANPSTRFVNALVYAAAGITGAMLAINGHMTVGAVVSFLVYAMQYTKPFNDITAVLTQLQSARSALERVMALLNEPDEPDEGRSLPRGTDVTVEGLTFGYGDKMVLEDVTLSAKFGEKVAVTGKTGAGKTTLINLLLRFYKPQSGRITLGGADIEDIPIKVLRAHFGMVLQDTYIFSGTIRDNIAFGNESASDEEVISAARSAYMHDFIMRLPKGYETPVSEEGESLSAGQRQLLCIARVMLRNPKILLLDEATSNLDPETEMYVHKAFDKLMQGKSSFVVAHRPATLENADKKVIIGGI